MLFFIVLYTTFTKYVVPVILNEFHGQPLIHTPHPPEGLSPYWKMLPNETGEEIILDPSKPAIVSQDSYLILPCNEDGSPISPPQILLRELRDIKEYL
jgi:hypothetical protein